MNKVTRSLRPYIKECILAPALKMTEACFELSVPLVVASIISDGIEKKNNGHIISMFIVLIVLGIAGLAFAVIAQYFSAKAATGSASIIRKNLFDHIRGLSFAEYDRLTSSKLITSLTSDISQIQTGINLTLRLILRAPFVVIGAFVMAFSIDTDSSMVFLIAIIILTVIAFAIMRFTMKRYRKIQEGLDSITVSARENITGARVIRAFCSEEYEEDKFATKNKSHARTQIKTGYISALLNPLTYSIVNIAISVLIYVGALKISAGHLSAAMVVALYNYMSQILVELLKMTNLAITMSKATASAKRVNDILSTETSVHFGSEREIDNGHIVFDHVSFKYPGYAENVLNDISFDIPSGKTLGIIGGTGSGKSTIAYLLFRMYDSDTGKIEIGGKNIKDYSKDAITGSMSLVFQKSTLYSGNIEENVTGGRELPEIDISEAIGSSQSEDIVSGAKDGMRSKVEQLGRNYSGGQKQRLSIARALSTRPKILVLDDSSSALDYMTERKLLDSIRDLDYRPSTIVISQRASSVMDLDNILVLNDGVCVGYGTHSELIQNCITYKEIYDTQFREEEK